MWDPGVAVRKQLVMLKNAGFSPSALTPDPDFSHASRDHHGRGYRHSILAREPQRFAQADA